MRILLTIWQVLRQQVKFFLLVFLGYLVQVCVMPYVKVGDITPSVLFALIGIVTVGYGRLRALWIGAIYGMLMEIMLPSLRMLYLVLYPLSAVFCSVFFADKSEKKLEYERSLNKAGRNMNPYLRTLLCAAANVLIYEIVNVMYIYLGGTTLTADHIGRAVTNLLATTGLTAIIIIPVRRFLGFKKLKKENPPPKKYQYSRL